jgi:hypothetical protein
MRVKGPSSNIGVLEDIIVNEIVRNRWEMCVLNSAELEIAKAEGEEEI